MYHNVKLLIIVKNLVMHLINVINVMMVMHLII